MFKVIVTEVPNATFNDMDARHTLPEPTPFQGFRAPTNRRSASIYGSGYKEIVLFDAYRHIALKTWATREAAEANVTRLAERKYTAHVEEV